MQGAAVPLFSPVGSSYRLSMAPKLPILTVWYVFGLRLNNFFTICVGCYFLGFGEGCWVKEMRREENVFWVFPHFNEPGKINWFKAFFQCIRKEEEEGDKFRVSVEWAVRLPRCSVKTMKTASYQVLLFQCI